METLRDTVGGMLSNDYKERLRAEYYQVKIRYGSLCRMLEKWKAGKLDFTPPSPMDLMEEQADVMYNYMKILEVRAQNEEVKL